MASFLTGVIAGLVIAMPPGAVTGLIVRTGLQRGFRAALAAGWGAATVDFVYCSVAVLAGAALIPLLGAIEGPLRAATGVVLIGLGLYGIVRSRHETPNDKPVGTRDLLATYVRFIGITMVNPATLAYFAAIAFGFSSSVLADAEAFIVGVFLASLGWQSMLALTSGALHGRLGPRARTTLTVVANGVVVALGVRILMQILGG